MKQKDNRWTIAIVGVLIIAAFGASFLLFGNKSGALSTTGDVVIDEATGEAIAPWTNKLVNYDLLTRDKYLGTDVAVTFKIYADKPADWGNPRGDFSDNENYETFTSTNGSVRVDTLFPATYYAVATASGYNTEFVTFTIPNGAGRSASLPDYQSNPDSMVVKVAALGTMTDTDFSFTLVNATSANVKGTILLTVADNTEFRGWKAIINDQEGFSTDSDGDGVYDEGVKKMTVTIGSESVVVFEPARGVDLFDSNNEYTMLLNDIVANGNDLTVKVDIVANTADLVSADDEKWGEGEGVLSYIKIYDAESNLRETTDVAA